MWVHRLLLASLLLIPSVLGYCPKRTCETTADCRSARRCCLSPVMRRGRKKRDLGGGVCSNKGKVGDLCYVREFTQDPLTILYLDACPCRDELECQGTDDVVVPQGRRGVCVEPPRQCEKSETCLSDECCVSKTRPIGRKKRQADELPGICMKLGENGDNCLVNNSPEMIGKKIFFVNCPCTNGLFCKGNGVQDNPLGETGTCSAPKK